MKVGRGILTFNVHLTILITLNVMDKMKYNTCYTVRTVIKSNCLIVKTSCYINLTCRSLGLA